MRPGRHALAFCLAAAGFAAAAFLPACTPESSPPADLIVVNAKIATLDPDRPEAGALAISGDRIVAVGDEASVLRRRGDGTRVVDALGRRVVPGFIEAHGHFLRLGELLMNVDVRSARTWEEVVERVREAASERPPGAWIFGRGWHQEKWKSPPEPSVQGFPVHDALTAAVPDRPVVLRHASGHASIANRAALERAGITRDTPDPPGGTILRDARGRPTGVLLENAEDLVLAAYARDREARGPGAREAELREQVARAGRDCLRKGVTSFHDAGSPAAVIRFFRRLADQGALPVRLYAMVNDGNDALESLLPELRRLDTADGFLKVRGIKRAVDGALGSRGAWLLEPYADLPSSTGLNTTPIPVLERTAELAAEHGYQLAIHAIGDRANREVLDLYARTFERRPEARRLRWRVEHAQHLHPDDIPRFAALDVIASMQPIHCTSDAPWVIPRLGEERARTGAYVWRSLLDSGARIVSGTDTPVEDVDPIANFHAAVTREYALGRGFFPEQRMTRLEALRAATRDAAYASFEEDVKGVLAPGAYADFVILSRDLLSVPDDEIRDVKVRMTVLAGRVVYEAEP